MLLYECFIYLLHIIGNIDKRRRDENYFRKAEEGEHSRSLCRLTKHKRK